MTVVDGSARAARASRAAPATRTRRASSSATACACSGSPTARASRRSSSSRPGRSCTRACGRRRSRTSRVTSASSASTRAATAAPTARTNRRPTTRREFAQDAIDVMDACGVDRAVCVALSTRRAARPPARDRASRARRRAWSSSARGSRSAGCVAALARCSRHPRMHALASRPPLTTRGWGKFNPHYWTHGGYADFVQWWAERMLTEPHSTKQIEDAIAWSHDTDGVTLALSVMGKRAAPGDAPRPDRARRSASAARCS